MASLLLLPPYLSDRMHQRRYCRLALFYCWSAAVACCTAGAFVAAEHSGGKERPDECGASATTAMWPAVWHGGRRSLEAAGPLPAGSALALCRSASGGKIVGQAAGHRQVADRYEAAGGCGPSRRHGQLPERSRGELPGA